MTAGDPRHVIPHRPPMLFIDAVAHADAESVTARREARTSDQWEGALIEGLAQTAAVLGAGGGASEPLLVGLKELAIQRLPQPGEQLVFHVQLVRSLLPLVLVEGRVDALSEDGQAETIAAGGLKFFVGERA